MKDQRKTQRKCFPGKSLWSWDMLCVLQGLLIESLGRKVLITGGYTLMSICCILFTLTLTFQVINLKAGQKKYIYSTVFVCIFIYDIPSLRWHFFCVIFLLLSGCQSSVSILKHGMCFCLYPEFWLRTRYLTTFVSYPPLKSLLSRSCCTTHITNSGFFCCCLLLSSLKGGVTNILTTELFTQTSRPAAYMIAGSVNWLSFFFISMVFPFIVVSAQKDGQLIEHYSTRFFCFCLVGLTYVLICFIYTDRAAAVLFPSVLGHLLSDGNVHIPCCSWNQEQNFPGNPECV